MLLLIGVVFFIGQFIGIKIGDALSSDVPDRGTISGCLCIRFDFLGTGEIDYADRPTTQPVPTFAPVLRGEAMEDDGTPIEPAEVEPASGTSGGNPFTV